MSSFFPSSRVSGIFVIKSCFLSSVNRFTMVGGSNPACVSMS